MTDSNPLERDARLRWVPISDMKINPLAQQELNQAWVDRLAAEFDIDKLDYPTVNHVNGTYHVIDGQHRIEMLRQIGWGDQKIQCWVYEGLTDEQEADRFLGLNNRKTVSVLARYKVAITAGHEIECDIDRIVRAQGLCVTNDQVPGAIGAPATLKKVYVTGGPSSLAKTLKIVNLAYGDPGLEAAIIGGIGLLCQRYNGELDTDLAVSKLANVHGGANGLLGKAETIRRSTGNAKGHCVAAAAVDIINQGTARAQKLPSWWKAAD